ncbi:MAG: oxidoreductase [Magnetovibrio sp.]|nr:oxidoreductase [Magnetovibrio sp.]
MSAVIINEVRKGFYLDSVALMRMSRTVADLDGVEEAAMMMGTPSNIQIMEDAGLLEELGKSAGGGDLIIGIRAVDVASVELARDKANEQLDAPAARGGDGEAWRPRTLRAAVREVPDANLALISVPGDFAIAEARKAIRRGLHAMIFSDNVEVEAEAELKREAQDLGRLVMGPDCGTAIINGTPLAFANVVSRGGIGIVGASGTGTQEVSCLISQYGGGISHAIGVGGRDLNSEVGGISTVMAIDSLCHDQATEHIVLISKPPPAEVASRVLDRIAISHKPATICFIGASDLPMPDNATQVFNLRAAARAALGLDDSNQATPKVSFVSVSGRSQIQGLYSGGTLCAEAQVLLRAAELAICSNAPVPGVPNLIDANTGHRLLDLGDDQYTQGRPHPMIEPGVRDDAIIAALNNPEIAIILVDVVIGYGAHLDPAGHLVAVLSANSLPDAPLVIASVTGTDEDPQVRSAQMAKLADAGVQVAPTNADAAQWAIELINVAS